MTKRQELLKINIPEFLTFEILGPKPPERVEGFSPTFARLELKPHKYKAIEITQNQNVSIESLPAKCDPFLFEETTYEFVIEIKDSAAQTQPISMLVRGSSPPDPLRRIGKTHAYTCQINFGSQIGYLDLEILLDNKSFLFIGLEVFPSKLDYRDDLRQIRKDIENEVRDLAFAVGKLTFHRTQRRRDVRAREVEWLENLRQLFSELAKAFNRIKRAPRYTIYRDEQIRQANRPSCTGATVRRYIRSHAKECVPRENGHFRAFDKSWRIRLLPHERKRLTYDTVENRYIKWALSILLRLVRKSTKTLGKTLLPETNTINEWKTLLEKTEQLLRKKLDAAFLKDCEDKLINPPQS